MTRFGFSVFTVLFALLYSCNAKKEDKEVLGLEKIQRTLQVLNDPAGITHDTNGFSELPKIDFFCDEQYDVERKYYSIIDLNGDGLKDLIYSGPCMGYDQTVIFIKEGSEFLKIFDYPGRVISVKKVGLITYVYSLHEPVGCYSDNSLIEILIKKDTTPVVNQIDYVNLPKMTLHDLRYIQVKGVLRWSPKEDDEDRKDVCSDNIAKGNHLLQIESKTRVIELAQEKDWYFVLHEINHANSILGWVKKE